MHEGGCIPLPATGSFQVVSEIVTTYQLAEGQALCAGAHSLHTLSLLASGCVGDRDNGAGPIGRGSGSACRCAAAHLVPDAAEGEADAAQATHGIGEGRQIGGTGRRRRREG